MLKQTPMQSQESEPAFGQLRWRCRRGMKELDQLLTRWLEQRFSSASSDTRKQFAQFLELPDPVVAAYLLGREHPEDPEQRALVEQIRAGQATAR